MATGDLLRKQSIDVIACLEDDAAAGRGRGRWRRWPRWRHGRRAGLGAGATLGQLHTQDVSSADEFRTKNTELLKKLT